MLQSRIIILCFIITYRIWIGVRGLPRGGVMVGAAPAVGDSLLLHAVNSRSGQSGKVNLSHTYEYNTIQ